MFTVKMCELPDEPVRSILILRTAQTPQVRWALNELRKKYPEARFAVLGTELEANELFDGMDHFQPTCAWLSPGSIKSLRPRLREARFDLVVMCLNSDCGAGYSRVSRVVRMIDARIKLVAGYNKEWVVWEHLNFEESNFLTRGIVNALEVLIYPIIAAYLLLTPSGPRYMPTEQGRPAPGYES